MRLFLDCDGVLADFDRLATKIFGMYPRKFEVMHGTSKFWSILKKYDNFYYHLPLMPDAKLLFNSVKYLNPTILTGCPRGNWAEEQKIKWAEKYFPGTPIITCKSKDKVNYMSAGDIIIDDWPKYMCKWKDAGGHFILCTSASQALNDLSFLLKEGKNEKLDVRI